MPQTRGTRALWHRAGHQRGRRHHADAIKLGREGTRREPPFSIFALEELAIHYEHRRRDFTAALAATEAALDCLRVSPDFKSYVKRVTYRRERLKKKTAGFPPLAQAT